MKKEIDKSTAPIASTNLCLFGASPNTGNQGVSALCWSTLEGIGERTNASMHVFRYGDGMQRSVVPGSVPPLYYQMEGMAGGRRIWRNNHLYRALCSARARLSGNAIVRVVQDADAVLDVSGGDSFTDMYGSARFNDVIAPKKLAMTLRRRLVLLPQTYGPFSSKRNERSAQNLVAGASLAYARDGDSYEMLQQILGSHFDASRHRLGVDLAFGLQARKPQNLEPGVDRALNARGTRPLLGINISGLLTNQNVVAGERFGLLSDYRELTESVVAALLNSSDAHILLVPHVHAPSGHYESDLDACRALVAALPDSCRAEANERITIVSRPYDASELKWLISQTEWFCGTRMHSTIAALSQGVPACALAYSLKTKGVFETCEAGDSVVDMRHVSTEEATGQVLRAWRRRNSFADTLKLALPQVKARGQQQLDEIVGTMNLAEAV